MCCDVPLTTTEFILCPHSQLVTKGAQQTCPPWMNSLRPRRSLPSFKVSAAAQALAPSTGSRAQGQGEVSRVPLFLQTPSTRPYVILNPQAHTGNNWNYSLSYLSLQCKTKRQTQRGRVRGISGFNWGHADVTSLGAKWGFKLKWEMAEVNSRIPWSCFSFYFFRFGTFLLSN